ncbi:ROK family protein [Echinicola marina]|uniref:ROK family protein n=1 Tax=Echinicola marina TaxID=2859768 RepID=UPI001CF62058|nr:ROK family protein [Echinicola marina]UCS93083.1 ROK family protein [Echinicola marina]
MKKSRLILGLDIGGTSINAGLLKDGKLIEKKVIPTPSHAPQEVILSTIAEFISSYFSYDIEGIGIGIPGLIDSKNGIVYNLENIPAFTKVALKKYLEEKLNKPVFINNDANCFALGEYKFGSASKYNHVVGITLGTGIGTGIITNNSLYTGFICGAGEWGGVPYMDSNFENYCGSKFFNTFHEATAKDLAEKAAKGDKKALDVFKEYGTHLGNLIKYILFTYAPEAVVIGGSISKAYPYFSESMHETVNTFPYKSISDHLEIYTSTVEDAAIMGATALVEETTVPEVNIAK